MESRIEELKYLIALLEYDMPNIKSKEIKASKEKLLHSYLNELKSLSKKNAF